MSNSMAHLRRQMKTAGDLQSVVRTMKAMAASSIEQYEHSVLALRDYYRAIELGLSACFQDNSSMIDLQQTSASSHAANTFAIVFGTDQGLVGRFNDVVADYVIESLTRMSGNVQVWAVGERVFGHLTDAGLSVTNVLHVPNSVQAVTLLTGQIQMELEQQRVTEEQAPVYVFHNSPQAASQYEPVRRRLLPIDVHWLQNLTQVQWPTKSLPEVLGTGTATLSSLIREYLFISLFQACAESLASENAARLSAMQRAEKNIEDLLETLQVSYHRLRQARIDEELFDVVAGFEAFMNLQKK